MYTSNLGSFGYFGEAAALAPTAAPVPTTALVPAATPVTPGAAVLAPVAPVTQAAAIQRIARGRGRGAAAAPGGGPRVAFKRPNTSPRALAPHYFTHIQSFPRIMEAMPAFIPHLPTQKMGPGVGAGRSVNPRVPPASLAPGIGKSTKRGRWWVPQGIMKTGVIVPQTPFPIRAAVEQGAAAAQGARPYSVPTSGCVNCR